MILKLIFNMSLMVIILSAGVQAAEECDRGVGVSPGPCPVNQMSYSIYCFEKPAGIVVDDWTLGQFGLLAKCKWGEVFSGPRTCQKQNDTCPPNTTLNQYGYCLANFISLTSTIPCPEGKVIEPLSMLCYNKCR